MNMHMFNNDAILKLLKSNDVKAVRLFGSSVRNEDSASSDIDLMVTFKKKKSLLTFVRLERELGEILGKKVDLVTENSISPYLLEQITKEARVVYDEKE